MFDASNTMKAVYLTGHGGYECLRWVEDAPRPKPGPGEVRIRVAAAGVNNTDINTRIGWYAPQVSTGTEETDGALSVTEGAWSGSLSFPRIQGADICGHVDAVGEGVSPQRIGERVLVEPCIRTGPDSFIYVGSEIDGGFAEYVVVPADYAHSIVCDWKDEELAAVPCSWSTAENLLTRAGLGSGQRVFITGASGGVGSAAVQLARRRGAEVIAQAGASKAEAVRALGAAEVIGRDRDPADVLGENEVDLVVDLVGGPQWPSLIRILRSGGVYAVSGAVAGPMVTLDLRQLYLKDLTFVGCTRLDPEVFPNLIRYLERGEVRPVVARTFPLRDIAEAQKVFLSKAHVGKLVLIP